MINSLILALYEASAYSVEVVPVDHKPLLARAVKMRQDRWPDKARRQGFWNAGRQLERRGYTLGEALDLLRIPRREGVDYSVPLN